MTTMTGKRSTLLNMSSFPGSPRRYQNARNAIYFLVGGMTGFLASSFLSLISTTQPQSSLRLVPLQSCAMDSPTSSKKEWSTIHVFTPNKSHVVDYSQIPNEYYHATRWFSQARQDEIVSQLFRHKKQGYFVDLAANDAIRISNTYALELYHSWQGLCIEPNPVYWQGLAHRNCTTVAAVIGQSLGQELLFKFPNRAPPQGGLVGPQFDNQNVSRFGEDRPVSSVPLAEIFQQFRVPRVIDYLSLDIEGAEYFVLENFPFDRYRFLVLTIERPSEALSDLLQRQGYVCLKQLKKWQETLWIHNSVRHVLDTVSALAIDTDNYKYNESPSSRQADH